MTDNVPRVWVGCLGCYNAGHLVGEWFAAEDAPQMMSEFRHQVIAPQLAGGILPEPWRCHFAEQHEELWVFDHENFHGLLTGECSPVTAKRLAELIAAIESDGYPVPAVAAWADWTGTEFSEWDGPTREAFEDAYCGERDSERDYAMDLASDFGLDEPSDRPWPLSYIDWDTATQDLFASDYWSAPSPDDGVYVFRSELNDNWTEQQQGQRR